MRDIEKAGLCWTGRETYFGTTFASQRQHSRGDIGFGDTEKAWAGAASAAYPCTWEASCSLACHGHCGTSLRLGQAPLQRGLCEKTYLGVLGTDTFGSRASWAWGVSGYLSCVSRALDKDRGERTCGRGVDGDSFMIPRIGRSSVRVHC
jgi:hypothetical protein